MPEKFKHYNLQKMIASMYSCFAGKNILIALVVGSILSTTSTTLASPPAKKLFYGIDLSLTQKEFLKKYSVGFKNCKTGEPFSVVKCYWDYEKQPLFFSVDFYAGKVGRVIISRKAPFMELIGAILLETRDPSATSTQATVDVTPVKAGMKAGDNDVDQMIKHQEIIVEDYDKMAKGEQLATACHVSIPYQNGNILFTGINNQKNYYFKNCSQKNLSNLAVSNIYFISNEYAKNGGKD